MPLCPPRAYSASLTSRWTRLSLPGMKQVNMHQAKTHLSRLVEEVSQGGEVVIAKAGKPVVMLAPYVPPAGKRVGGMYKGRIKESADCWTADVLEESLDQPLYTMTVRKPRRVAERKKA